MNPNYREPRPSAGKCRALAPERRIDPGLTNRSQSAPGLVSNPIPKGQNNTGMKLKGK